jgi:hypothetical protein
VITCPHRATRGGGTLVEPLTVGALVALALSTATESIVKGVAEEATKDAYRALKEKLSQLNPDDVEALVNSPSSTGRQVVVAELVDNRSKDERENLRALAQSLANAMSRRVSDNLPAIWNAELSRREPRRFVISFTKNGSRHKLEFNPVFGKINDPVELDGQELTRIWIQGTKNLNFNLAGSQFQLRFYMSHLTGRLSNIEFWADNELILQSP